MARATPSYMKIKGEATKKRRQPDRYDIAENGKAGP